MVALFNTNTFHLLKNDSQHSKVLSFIWSPGNQPQWNVGRNRTARLAHIYESTTNDSLITVPEARHTYIWVDWQNILFLFSAISQSSAGDHIQLPGYSGRDICLFLYRKSVSVLWHCSGRLFSCFPSACVVPVTTLYAKVPPPLFSAGFSSRDRCVCRRACRALRAGSEHGGRTGRAIERAGFLKVLFFFILLFLSGIFCTFECMLFGCNHVFFAL